MKKFIKRNEHLINIIVMVSIISGLSLLFILLLSSGVIRRTDYHYEIFLTHDQETEYTFYIKKDEYTENYLYYIVTEETFSGTYEGVVEFKNVTDIYYYNGGRNDLREYIETFWKCESTGFRAVYLNTVILC